MSDKDIITNRYDFFFLYEVINGNPNGDPDTEGAPRQDFETEQGKVSDVCIKRKIRNYIDFSNYGEGHDTIIKRDAVLNPIINGISEEKKTVKGTIETLCQKYFDVRTFGQVLSTAEKVDGKSLNNVSGVVEIFQGVSVDPITIMNNTITRMCSTNEKEKINKKTKEIEKADNKTFGQQYFIPYAIYKQSGCIIPSRASGTGFTTGDRDKLFDAIWNMWLIDHSVMRGLISNVLFIVFEHDNSLGNCQPPKLSNLISANKKTDVEHPRSITDYEIVFDESNLPKGVSVFLKKEA